jgi:hypothetical protein
LRRSLGGRNTAWRGRRVGAGGGRRGLFPAKGSSTYPCGVEAVKDHVADVLFQVGHGFLVQAGRGAEEIDSNMYVSVPDRGEQESNVA